MGLDQWAYIKVGRAPEYLQGVNKWDYEYDNCWVLLKRWRKHPNLQGWMERCWRNKNNSSDSYEADTLITDEFNGVEFELTLDDINELEEAVKSKTLNGGLGDTTGFFFGDNSDSDYFYDDIDFCKYARNAIKGGLRVYYDSSW